jgi:hypothetical protein
LTKLTKNRKYPKNPDVIVSVFISRGSDFPGAFDHQAAIQALREIAVLQDIITGRELVRRQISHYVRFARPGSGNRQDTFALCRNIIRRS